MGIEREARIDFLRGITLLLIFIGHAEFSFSETFQHSRGFADASEIFVLLAGISCALAYWRPAAGLSLTRPWKRAWRIYLVHLLLFAVMATIAALLIADYPHPVAVNDFAGFLDRPLWRSLQALPLLYMPGNLDILPMYVVLLLWAPFALALLERVPKTLFAGSVILWLVAGLGHLNLYNLALDTHHWFFDPLSWQLIFTIGLALGMRIRTGRAPLPYHRGLFILAAAFALIAIPVNLVLYLEWLTPPYDGLYRELVSKTNSGPLRILDALAILYLAWNIEAVRRAATSRILRPLTALGRHSLPIFSLGVILSAAASIYLDIHPHTSLPVELLILVTGCILHLALGLILERRRARSRLQPVAVTTGMRDAAPAE